HSDHRAGPVFCRHHEIESSGPEGAMRAHVNVCLVSVALLGFGAFASSVNSQGGGHLNPQVDLLAAKKPVLGLGLPNGRGATPPKTPLDLAKDAIAHP